MKEKRLLQRLGEAVVSASSHKGMAHAHTGTRVHGFSRQAGAANTSACVHKAGQAQGNPLRVKPGLVAISATFTAYVNEHSPAHTKPHQTPCIL